MVLCGFHLFPFAGALVVDAAEMQNAMNDDAVQFLIVREVKVLGIGTDGIQADEEVATDDCTFCVVKGDDICVIIVLQELTVDAQDFLVIHKDVCNFSHPASIRDSNSSDPSSDGGLVNSGQGDVDGLKGNHVGEFRV